MTDVMPPQALTSVPGCMRNRLQQPTVNGAAMTDVMPPQALASAPRWMCNRMQHDAAVKL